VAGAAAGVAGAAATGEARRIGAAVAGGGYSNLGYRIQGVLSPAPEGT
jgi:hypothetical protein